MKKNYSIFILFIAVFLLSCKDELTPLAAAEPEVTVENGMLSFSSMENFNKVFADVTEKDNSYLDNWEGSLGFTSLRSIFNQVVKAENEFSDNLSKIHGENAVLSREKFGYTEVTNKNKEILIFMEDGSFDLDVTTFGHSYILNAEGLVKIGGKIYNFTKDYVKVLGSNSFKSFSHLKTITCSDESANIFVSDVQRETNILFESHNQKTNEIVKTCIATNNKDRLIVYEDYVYYAQGGTPCYVYSHNYLIKLRNLKKNIFGSWVNSETGSMRITGKLRIDQTKKVDDFGYVFDKVIVDVPNIDWPFDYGHTGEKYYMRNYPVCFPANLIRLAVHDITGYGRNWTSCRVGDF